jgi:hypothetical protein
MTNFEIYTYLKSKKGGGSGDNSTLDAFIDRSLTSINNNRVTSIGANAFRSCANLTAAVFSEATSIGGSAFFECANLTTIVLSVNSVVSLSNTSAFGNTPIARGTGYIYVPDDLIESYKTATNWTVYAEQIKGLSQLPEGV